MALLEVMREYLNEKTVLATCASWCLLKNYRVIKTVLSKYIMLLKVFTSRPYRVRSTISVRMTY